MKTFVILLRGVTPTGKNRVPMAQLRTALADAGLTGVQTYIQSGNVIARSDLDQGQLQSLVHDVIVRQIGADISIIARTVAQFSQIMIQNPFAHSDSARLYFTLLSSQADPKLLQGVFATDFSPDEVRIIGDTIYTLYATKYSDSRFNNNFFERKLKVAATTRNFNTMTSLAGLALHQN